MPKVTLVQVVYNSRGFIEPVFTAMINQTYRDHDIVAVIAGNDDGSKELIAEKFPEVKIIDPGYNIGFAKGHNLVFAQCEALTRPSNGHPLPEGEGNIEIASEFFQLVNPDLIMEPDYVEKMLKAFEDPKVGAATGKLYKIPESGIMNYESWKKDQVNSKCIIDTTGVLINRSGSARDRGQHEIDSGQYDQKTNVQAVSAAGAMYRRSVLEAVKLPKQNTENSKQNTDKNLFTEHCLLSTDYEYFDEDFHSYWEDVDLTWRMTNAGFKCVYVPKAVAYHGRGAGSSKGGYKKVFSYIKFHSKLSPRIRQLNYQNHIFMYVKNSPWFYPQFFFRELMMFVYICLFEISTLKVIPGMVRMLPKMWQKRKIIKKQATGRKLRHAA